MAILFLETLPETISTKTMLVEVFEPQFALKALKKERCVNMGDLVKTIKKGTLSNIIEEENDKNATYMVNWKYEDVVYYLVGKIKLDELKKIIQYMKF